MAILKSPPKLPKNETLQLRIEEEVRSKLKKYAEFLDSSESYVVSEALKLLFKKDEEFKTWLSEPCRTVVALAVLTGLRIGEILALWWKRVDMLRGTIEVAETFTDGQFGSPKTRSSRRVIPMSEFLRKTLEAHRSRSIRTESDDLVFTTPKGTPLSSKNLHN